LKREQQLFSKRNVAKLFDNVGNQLFNNLNVSGILFLLFYPNASEMTKFVLNDMFENIKVTLKRAISSDQIKSSMLFSLQFYIQVDEVLHYVSQ